MKFLIIFTALIVSVASVPLTITMEYTEYLRLKEIEKQSIAAAANQPEIIEAVAGKPEEKEEEIMDDFLFDDYYPRGGLRGRGTLGWGGASPTYSGAMRSGGRNPSMI
eukprot:Pgem_evm1s2697